MENPLCDKPVASCASTKYMTAAMALALAFACTGASAAAPVNESYAGRAAWVYAPAQMPPMGSRALVVVLHGGLGNAERLAAGKIESALNMNAVADAGGFLVVYLSGTPVARFLGADKLGWNAGACCGQPAEKNVDDVAYIRGAVDAIAQRYGVDRSRIYGVGHSNGAMMTQRMVCETPLYASAVAISGPLESGAPSCPAARGKQLMAIHGADDQNVPIVGGRGKKGLARVDFVSQAATRDVWLKSGATYDLHIVAGAEHSVDSINTQLLARESQTLAQKIARFLGLLEK